MDKLTITTKYLDELKESLLAGPLNKQVEKVCTSVADYDAFMGIFNEISAMQALKMLSTNWLTIHLEGYERDTGFIFVSANNLYIAIEPNGSTHS